MKRKVDAVIVGGGPAGLAAALELHKLGTKNVLIIEREKHLGGILRQCIHDGFGLIRFKHSLTGPEYAQKFIDEIHERDIEYRTDTTVIEVTADKCVRAVSKDGYLEIECQAVILTTGCRERTRGAISIPGSRPSGVYTAGVAQAYMNLHNIKVGKTAVILGSGDIGLIMARRLTLEGVKVLGVFEVQAYPSGLNRNIVQCLDDYNIPLYLGQTVTEIHGTSRLKGVTVSSVDDERRPIFGSEKFIETDTLILSVGLIPETELSLDADVRLDRRTNGPLVDEKYQTSTPGIFSAGNALHVHDLVDFVSIEAETLACSVHRFIEEGLLEEKPVPGFHVPVQPDENISYTVPQMVCEAKNFTLYFRAKKPCQNQTLTLFQGDSILYTKKIQHILPAEMEKITVPGAQLINDTPLEVTLK